MNKWYGWALLLLATAFLSGCSAIVGVFYPAFRASADEAAAADIVVSLATTRSFNNLRSFSSGTAEVHVLLLPFVSADTAAGEDPAESLDRDRIEEVSFVLADFTATTDGRAEAAFVVERNAVYRVFVYLDQEETTDAGSGDTIWGNGGADFTDPMRLACIGQNQSTEEIVEPVSAFDFTFGTEETPRIELEVLLEPTMRLEDEELWILEQLMAESDDGENDPPTAALSPGLESVSSMVELSFDGRGSTDDDGWIVSWNWNFGDGEHGVGDTVLHTFRDTTFTEGETAAHIYAVSLTVTDNRGATASDTMNIPVYPPPEGWVYRAIHVNGDLDYSIPAADLSLPLRAALFRAQGENEADLDLAYTKSLGLLTQRNVDFNMQIDEVGTYSIVVWLDEDDDGLIDAGEHGAETSATTDDPDADTTSTFRSGEPDEYTAEVLVSEGDPPEGEHEIITEGTFLLSRTSRIPLYYYSAINTEGAVREGTKQEPAYIEIDETHEGSVALGKSSYYYADVHAFDNEGAMYTVTVEYLSRDVDLKVYRAIEDAALGIDDVVSPGVFAADAWEDEVAVSGGPAALRIVGSSFFAGIDYELATFMIPASTEYILIEVIPLESYGVYDLTIRQQEINENPIYSRVQPFLLTKELTDLVIREDEVLYFFFATGLGQTYEVHAYDYAGQNDLNLECFSDADYFRRINYSYAYDPDEVFVQEALAMDNNDGTHLYFRVVANRLAPDVATEGLGFRISVGEAAR